MALFSCGDLAHEQMLKKFSNVLNTWKILPDEAADILLLNEYSDSSLEKVDPQDAELRTKLITGLSTLVDPSTGQYYAGTDERSFYQVLAHSELKGLFRNDKTDPRSVQLSGLMDIQSGLDTVCNIERAKTRLGLGDNTADWVKAYQPTLGTTPLEIMRKGGERGVDLVACFVSASRDIVTASDLMNEVVRYGILPSQPAP